MRERLCGILIATAFAVGMATTLIGASLEGKVDAPNSIITYVGAGLTEASLFAGLYLVSREDLSESKNSYRKH